MEKWADLQKKYANLSFREQGLILITGLAAIVFIIFSFVIDSNIAGIDLFKKQIAQNTSTINSTEKIIREMQEGLRKNPNKALNQQIAQYETKLAKVDNELLELTSDLINPIQMRYALIELLRVQKGVSLVSFQLLGVQPLLSSAKTDFSQGKLSQGKTSAEQRQPKVINTVSDSTSDKGIEKTSLNLYRHGIKIKLTGNYFQLRDYLTQLENLSWKFFWQEFNYNLAEYPVSELEIEMYSLSTKREFIGV
ncbi:MAG: hypothetical protein HRT38_00610 [Alteromonadaceae bacterium]|nr:hypothetical protein [Alteromonadaceae bacterium]